MKGDLEGQAGSEFLPPSLNSRVEPSPTKVSQMQRELDALKRQRGEESADFLRASQDLWLPEPHAIKDSCSRFDLKTF